MKSKVCFVVDYYPTKYNNGCVFVKHLITAIADQGYECTVITPQVFMPQNFKKENRMPYKRTENTDKGNTVTIYAPFYVHCSSNKKTMKRSMNNHYKAVLKTIEKHKLKPDIMYGHFIYQNGLTAARIGKKLGIPAYCACGENSLRLMKDSQPYSTGLKYAYWRKILDSLSGIISVSSYNKQLLLENGFIGNDMKISVIPNSVDQTKFFKCDQQQMRHELGLPEDKFIVAFVGQFKESKGIIMLSNALDGCPDVYSLFIGKGSLKPTCDNILFSGVVDNSELYKYLNAADTFILPTQGEGCSNAIIEALACGLPVISTDLPFNHDILNETNSILINNEEELIHAILKLKKDDSFRNTLQDGALKTAEMLDINKRAEKILGFINLIK